MDDRQDYAAIDERGVYAVTLKDPPFAVTAKARAAWDRDVAKFCSDAIRKGHRVELMPIAEACKQMKARIALNAAAGG